MLIPSQGDLCRPAFGGLSKSQLSDAEHFTIGKEAMAQEIKGLIGLQPNASKSVPDRHCAWRVLALLLPTPT